VNIGGLVCEPCQKMPNPPWGGDGKPRVLYRKDSRVAWIGEDGVFASSVQIKTDACPVAAHHTREGGHLSFYCGFIFPAARGWPLGPLFMLSCT